MSYFQRFSGPKILGWAPPEDTGNDFISLSRYDEQSYYSPMEMGSVASSSSSTAPSPLSAGGDLPYLCQRGQRAGNDNHDPHWVPRPRNPFIIFRCQYSKDHANEGDVKATSKSLSKRAGEAWKHMPDAEKVYYKKLAMEEKKMHEVMYPDYRFRPRRGAGRMRPSRTAMTQRDRDVHRKARVAMLVAHSKTLSESGADECSSPESGILNIPSTAAIGTKTRQRRSWSLPSSTQAPSIRLDANFPPPPLSCHSSPGARPASPTLASELDGECMFSPPHISDFEDAFANVVGDARASEPVPIAASTFGDHDQFSLEKRETSYDFFDQAPLAPFFDYDLKTSEGYLSMDIPDFADDQSAGILEQTWQSSNALFAEFVQFNGKDWSLPELDQRLCDDVKYEASQGDPLPMSQNKSDAPLAGPGLTYESPFEAFERLTQALRV